MSIQERIVIVLACILISVNLNADIGQSLGTEKALYDFKITWTMNASLDINSDNPYGLVHFNVSITNTGMMPDQYTFGAGCSCGWPTVVSPQSIPIGKGAVVLPGESFNFNVTTVVSFPRPGWVCHMKITAQSDSSPQEITKEEDIPLIVHSPFLAVRSLTTFPSAPVDGQDVTISAILVNDGNYYEPRSNISFFIDKEAWALNISAGRMDPGETRNISVKWKAVKGNHTLEARTQHYFADDENWSQNIKLIIKPVPVNDKIDIKLYDLLPAILLLILLVVLIVIKIRPRKKR